MPVEEKEVTYLSSLEHTGIAGQKWGLRRYRNTDGTLTEAGKRRYAKHTEQRDMSDPERYFYAKQRVRSVGAEEAEKSEHTAARNAMAKVATVLAGLATAGVLSTKAALFTANPVLIGAGVTFLSTAVAAGYATGVDTIDVLNNAHKNIAAIRSVNRR